MTKEICKNVDTASKTVEGINYTVVLRGDSTLRGHFPEVIAVSFYGQLLLLAIPSPFLERVDHSNFIFWMENWLL